MPNNDNPRNTPPAIMGDINQDDLAAFREYAERAIADVDKRTPILSFNEWLSAGRPRGPFTNG